MIGGKDIEDYFATMQESTMTLRDELDETGFAAGEILPVIVCLDCSESMKSRMDDLHDAMFHFTKAVREHDLAKNAVEWEFISFQTKNKTDTPELIEHIGDFQRATELFELQHELEAHGKTPLAEVIELALDKLEAKKKYYKDLGQPYYQPWLVVMTDGAPTSPPDIMKAAIERVTKLVEKKKLAVIAVGIGAGVNEDFLTQLSPKRKPDMIGGKDIKDYFIKLSDSIIKASSGVVVS
jgi:uncharacterized protein YegL